MTKLTDSIKNMRQHGDAVRIASIVNKQRIERGEETISPAYVRSMLNGNRKMTKEVSEVSKTFFETQEELNQVFATN
ncbi:hypothetical protein [Dysgonomonas sp. ZJ279]|uniref:hypothetical protein n=1 Tax=Dysgonomonas sp. ZJ279 TaxID=2709796 RepID=UPI0013EABFB9|nr:hypothetical protein [Dysgonomonas sp. ZJ279]